MSTYSYDFRHGQGRRGLAKFAKVIFGESGARNKGDFKAGAPTATIFATQRVQEGGDFGAAVGWRSLRR